MQDTDFLTVEAHYEALVSNLEPSKLTIYSETVHAKVETAHSGRAFILYKMQGEKPIVIDRLVVEDLQCHCDEGLSAMFTSTLSGSRMVVGYTPVQLENCPVFIFIPLHAKIRWASRDPRTGGSLAFPLVIRTANHYGQRRNRSIMFEPETAFLKEFHPRNAG